VLLTHIFKERINFREQIVMSASEKETCEKIKEKKLRIYSTVKKQYAFWVQWLVPIIPTT
jgi:hypothetical protein